MVDLSELNIWENVYDYVIKECEVDGGRYIAPTNVVNGVVFYNKNLFANAGCTVPTTWTEFIQVCEKIKTYQGGITANKAPIVTGTLDSWPVAIMTDIVEANAVRGEDPDFFYNLATGDIGMDSALVGDAITKVDQMGDYFQTGATGMQYALVAGRFSTGSYGMMIDGSWQLSQIRECEPDFEVGTFILPSNNDASKNTNVCFKTGGGFSAVKGTGVEDLAKRYIEFHMRKDVLQRYADECLMGAVRSDIEYKDELAKIFYESSSSINKILLAENMFVRGMPGYDTTLITDLFTGRKTASSVHTQIASQHTSYSAVWAAYVRDWLEIHYPDKQ